MYSGLARVLSSYMVRSAWTCLIALQLPVLETGAAVFIDDLSEKDLDRPLWKGYSEAAEVKKYCKNAYKMVSSFTKLKLLRLFIRSLNLC